jgi:hypothetical protein
MPVVTPSRASMETVNAVSKRDSFLAAMRFRPSSSHRCWLRARQIRPRPSFAMKLMASGVTNWAAIVRSPSFSRPSSSHTTTIRPARISSMASGMLANTPATRAPLCGQPDRAARSTTTTGGRWLTARAVRPSDLRHIAAHIVSPSLRATLPRHASVAGRHEAGKGSFTRRKGGRRRGLRGRRRPTRCAQPAPPSGATAPDPPRSSVDRDPDGRE